MTLRRVGCLLAGAGLLLTLAGCNTSSITKQELVVEFSNTAPQSQHAAALKACSNATPAARPEPFETASKYLSNNVENVRFRIDHADDQQIARLEECLAKQPGVIGFDQPDLTD